MFTGGCGSLTPPNSCRNKILLQELPSIKPRYIETLTFAEWSAMFNVTVTFSVPCLSFNINWMLALHFLIHPIVLPSYLKIPFPVWFRCRILSKKLPLKCVYFSSFLSFSCCWENVVSIWIERLMEIKNKCKALLHWFSSDIMRDAYMPRKGYIWHLCPHLFYFQTSPHRKGFYVERGFVEMDLIWPLWARKKEGGRNHDL